MAKSNDYAVILMDIEMPVMNGIDATKSIRQSGYTGKIFAYTGKAADECLIQTREAGMDDCIFKPIKPEKLFNLIEKH